ncbi:MAG: YdiU family protein [Gammaproteobacteria bacterium]|nr:YdiU family protein [Gammaproteobacteria bacterium]
MKHIPLNNRFLDLGSQFYRKSKPVPVTAPALIKFNKNLASMMGLSIEDTNLQEATLIFAGNQLPEGSIPLAMAYSGSQFGSFNPQLGDGRAIYLGEVNAPDGKTFDVQLKGSGRTAYSRNGDGRSALGPVLREYLVSEAMYKLNVPTTRALAAVTTGEEVARETLGPGGILTRVASSFVRVGTFQYFAAKGDLKSIKILADYVIERNYQNINGVDNLYLEFFKSVVERQAKLIAQWMQLGFIHGVMNTDNMSVAGETIDYGPCAFMDEFNHNQVYSFIDRGGRYAYSQQPPIGLWNLTRLAECLVPLFAEDTETAVELAKEVLQSYETSYEKAWLEGMRIKFGLVRSDDNAGDIQDKKLIESLFEIMQMNHADFTLTFFYLSRLNLIESDIDEKLKKLFDKTESIEAWLGRWRLRLSEETTTDEERQLNMQSVNPVYIPRNHLIEEVIRAAEDNNDFTLFHKLHVVLEDPFTLQPGMDKYMLPPEPEQVVENTFCGT